MLLCDFQGRPLLEGRKIINRLLLNMLAVAFLICAGVQTRAQEYAPFLEYSGRLYDFSADIDSEVEGYFSKIHELRQKSLTAAAKNYQRFVKDYFNYTALEKGRIIPLRQKVFSLIMEDRELLREYRRIYEPTVKEDFKKAKKNRDPGSLESLVDYFLPCEHGLKALTYIVLHYMDHGDIDRAVYYLDLLKKIDTESLRAERIQKALKVLSKKPGTERLSSTKPFKINTEQPVWIGGVATSIVYPGDIADFRKMGVYYPLVFTEESVVVNTGTDLYRYDRNTGRHMWKPGAYHSVRMVSLFKGDPVSAYSEESDSIFIDVKSSKPADGLFLPVGALYSEKQVIVGVLNKIKNGNRIILCEKESGRADTVVTGNDFRDDMKDEEYDDILLTSMPCIDEGVLYMSMAGLSRYSENDFCAAFSLENSSLLWIKEFSNIQTHYMYSSGRRSSLNLIPREGTLVTVRGPYVVFFSKTGYVGVLRRWDGRLVWKRNLHTEISDRRHGNAEQSIVPFKALITDSNIIINGVKKYEVSCLAISDGTYVWRKKEVGRILWGLDFYGSPVFSVKNKTGKHVLKMNDQNGDIEWIIDNGGVYPGCIAGDTVVFADEDAVYQVNADTGDTIQRFRPEQCLFPGRIYINNNFYLVNSGGVFAYEIE